MRDKRRSVVQPCTNKQDLIPSVNSSAILGREDAPSAGLVWGGRGRAGEVRGRGLMLYVREDTLICECI